MGAKLQFFAHTRNNKQKKATHFAKIGNPHSQRLRGLPIMGQRGLGLRVNLAAELTGAEFVLRLEVVVEGGDAREAGSGSDVSNGHGGVAQQSAGVLQSALADEVRQRLIGATLSEGGADETAADAEMLGNGLTV